MDVQPPLRGITVIDMTANIAGPFATLTLRGMGARIIKIEPPGGDVSRRWMPADEDASAVFSAFNRGKESVQIDAKQSEGQDLIRKMVSRADVFVESFRPGKIDALGLGWDHLEAVKPDLVYCSINAFGESGPAAGLAGFDAIVQAYTGLMDLTGERDGPPCRVGAAVVDVGTGLWAALSTVGALMQRRVDGCGRHVTTTMLGAAVAYSMHHLVATMRTGVAPTRIGTAQHNFAPYEAIRTATRLVMVGVNSDTMWRKFCVAIGDPALASDPRFESNSGRVHNRVELVEAIERCTRTLAAPSLVQCLHEAGIAAAEVRGIADLVDDKQLDAVGLWALAPNGTRYPRVPLSWSPSHGEEVPAAGEHTEQMLRELGIDRRELEELATLRVIAGGLAETNGWDKAGLADVAADCGER
jgi:CoA:oxalate CoA-transferase